MPRFHDAVPALLQRLEAEAAAGVRDLHLDGDLAEARAAWKALTPELQIDARPMAEALGALTRNRPAPPGGAYGRAPAARAEASPPVAATQSAEFRYYDGPLDPDALLAYMGLSGFRPGQREAVEAALAGRDSLVVMPTGGGKSLCYQLPGLATSGITVIVTPLVALMADQLRRLTADGHPAVMIASGMGEAEGRAAFDALRSGAARIVFCSPERFGSPSFLNVLAQRGVDLFVIDEAHCLSEWGQDFRPDYRRLPQALERLGRPPVMAATATATEAVSQDIVHQLGLREHTAVRSGFDRPNLSFDVLTFEGKGTVDAKRGVLLGALSDPELRPAIVYCGTRKDTESVAELLSGNGIAAEAYHAGLAPDARTRVQQSFMEGRADVIVATNAFGMGVDKADVRLVCHWALPTSVEAYYQEAGRGGRDGAPARALLLASRMDLSRLVHFNQQRLVEPEAVHAYHQRLLRQSDHGVLEIDRPERDEDRTALAIIEQSGGATLEPAQGLRVRLTLQPTLDDHRVGHHYREAKDRGWRAYRAIEAYGFGDSCRRRTLLDHFGDHTAGAPLGRCCDICDPDLQLPPPKAIKKTRSSGSSGGGGGGSSEPSPYNPDPELYEALVVWRREAAADKPAYTVATNRTLEAIADVRPTNELELGAIKGVGPAFIDKFAGDVLEIIGA